MGSDPARTFLTRWRMLEIACPLLLNLTRICSEVNLHAMRLGPGKHLKGLSLFHGLVKPEEVSFNLSTQIRISAQYGAFATSSTTFTRCVGSFSGHGWLYSQPESVAHHHPRDDTNWSPGLF
jgi:hypothetical protein